MFDHFGLPNNPNADMFPYIGNCSSTSDWVAFRVPQNRTMLMAYVVGAGGGGGTGVIGANSTAAGGGAGGSGGTTIITIPIAFLPKEIYLQAFPGTTAAGLASRVGVGAVGAAVTIEQLCVASGGNVGGNASGATGGTPGGGVAAVAASAMPLGYLFSAITPLGGSAGGTGGSTGNGVGVSMPTTGGRVTGGAGGGGLGAVGANGGTGGIVSAGSSVVFPSAIAAIGGLSSTTPPVNGSNGFSPSTASPFYFYGGNGGGGTHGSATGAGLVQASGGDGAQGCGGGGMGGALTGSTPAVQAKGGAGFIVIICW